MPGDAASAAMQTIQCFAGSLQEYIPKRLLAPRDDGEDYLLGNVSGEYNFHFTFRLEGGGFFQTGVLVASAESTVGRLPVPLRCKWRRRIGDMLVEIPSVTSNMYQISADDVGTDICVEAAPADPDDGHTGVAHGEIGPFELDPSTRRSLDNALGRGGHEFFATQLIPGDPDGVHSVKISINATGDSVKVTPLQAGEPQKDREVVAEYSSDYPKVIIHPLDTFKFQLVMAESKTYHMQAQSRTARDLIALTVRCFHARSRLSTASILQELFPVHSMAVQGSTSGVSNESHLDECIVLERLTKELNRCMQVRDTCDKVLRNTKREKEQLLTQLEETIYGFTEVMKGLQGECAQGAAAAAGAPTLPVEKLQEQFREAQGQNQALQGELQAMRKQLEDVRRLKQAAAAQQAAGGAGGSEVLQLQEERDLLKVRLHELSSSSGQKRDQANQEHTLELKRLRFDVEALHEKKEELRRQWQDTERARQELQENFLYVKGQLDKVQMKQAQTSASGSSEDRKELERLRQGLSIVQDERQRLNMRAESTIREVEKEKANHELSLERLMTANARLMEEKDRVEKDMKRLSQLYAESVQHVQHQHDVMGAVSMDGLDTTTTGVGAVASSVNQEELTKLMAQIAQVDESLTKKAQENESLKNRIRKLAQAEG